jgi:cytochrome c oxidase subunit 2
VKRDWVSWVVLWVVLTALGEAAFFMFSPLPTPGSEEAEVFNWVFSILTVLGIAVFMFIVAALIVSAVKFRVPDDADHDDGPYIPDNRHLVHRWEQITIALTLFLIIVTGFMGLSRFNGEQSGEMVIAIQGQQWSWVITHENGGAATEELVVPVDTRIRYDVSSTDILHSFWVPAFAAKVDAVPGRPTVIYVTAIEEADGATNVLYRLQCAELCGLGHAAMAINVRVVSRAEYQTYIASLEGGS